MVISRGSRRIFGFCSFLFLSSHHKLMSKSSRWSQGRKTPSGRKKRTKVLSMQKKRRRQSYRLNRAVGSNFAGCAHQNKTLGGHQNKIFYREGSENHQNKALSGHQNIIFYRRGVQKLCTIMYHSIRQDAEKESGTKSLPHITISDRSYNILVIKGRTGPTKRFVTIKWCADPNIQS